MSPPKRKGHLIVMIPCYNEEKTLPLVINSIPKEIAGVGLIETLVIDDGCTDSTVDVARSLGVNYIVRFPRNRGLAAAFKAGLCACLELGADIIVNTDGDNQYPQAEIPRLIKPILEGRADIVIGARQQAKIDYYTPLRRLLHRLGNWVVQRLSETNVDDAPSGFRAYSREAALRVNIVSGFSYTIETIIQAGKSKLSIESIPIVTNPRTRESRLFRNLAHYLRESGMTIIGTYATYEPLRVFTVVGMVALTSGGLLGLRFFWFWIHGQGRGHVQSLLLSSVLLILGVQVFLMGLTADLIRANRRLLEDLLYWVRKDHRNSDLE